MAQRIELFFLTWVTELKPSFHDDSMNWTFLNMTQRIELFLKYDSKNWNLFEIWLKESNSRWNITHRIEPFFSKKKTWPKELNLFFQFATQRIEPLFLKLRLEELNFFKKKWLEELSILLKYDSKNWTLWNMTHSIESFEDSRNRTLLYDSKNGTFYVTWLTELNPSWTWLT